MSATQFVKKKVDIVGITEGQRKSELEKKRIKLAARKWEFVEYHDSGMMGSFALFNVPKEVDQQERMIKVGIGGLIGLVFLVIILKGGNHSELSPEQVKQRTENTAQVEQHRKEEAAKNQAEADLYAKFVKSNLLKGMKSADVYIKADGFVRWMGVTISYQEWLSFNKEERRTIVVALLRGMKQTFPNSGLQVLVGIDENQPLAEGEWGQLSDGPSVKLIGE